MRWPLGISVPTAGERNNIMRGDGTCSVYAEKVVIFWLRYARRCVNATLIVWFCLLCFVSMFSFCKAQYSQKKTNALL